MLSKLVNDMKAAMKNGEKSKLKALRNIIGKIKATQIDTGKILNEDESIKIIKSSTKQLKDSIKQYKIGGRDDLVLSEEFELSVLQKYLPKQINENDLRDIVKNIIKEVNATSVKDIGKVMSAAMKAVNGKADGSNVQKIVREELST